MSAGTKLQSMIIAYLEHVPASGEKVNPVICSNLILSVFQAPLHYNPVLFSQKMPLIPITENPKWEAPLNSTPCSDQTILHLTPTTA